MKQSVRVILFQGDQLVLLQGRDVNDPARPAWFYTIGGSIEGAENQTQAAIRETWEETGVKLSSTDLHGPIFQRKAWRDFAVNPYSVNEIFYWANVNSDIVLSDERWTESERKSVLAMVTLTVSELKAFRDRGAEIFPDCLPELAESILYH